MKIERKSVERVDFINIEVGEVFADTTTNCICMKIAESEVDGEIANAISLADGEVYCYSDRAIVQKLNAKVVIE